MINPKSLENLRSFNQISPEKHKEISSKGGRASGASRRKFARLKRFFDAYMIYLENRGNFEEISRMKTNEVGKKLRKLEEL